MARRLRANTRRFRAPRLPSTANSSHPTSARTDLQEQFRQCSMRPSANRSGSIDADGGFPAGRRDWIVDPMTTPLQLRIALFLLLGAACAGPPHRDLTFEFPGRGRLVMNLDGCLASAVWM